MTRRLDRALERVRTLPPETQDEDARVLLRLADDDEGDVDPLTPEEAASLATSLEQAERGAFAGDEDAQAVRAEHDLRDCATRRKPAEFAQALDGIAEHSPQGARRGRSRIRKAVGLPGDHPCRGPRTSLLALRRTVVARIPA